MIRTWTSWLLAGALVASLQWNLRRPDTTEGSPETGTAMETAPRIAPGECRLAPESMGLSKRQARALSETCRTSCEDAEALEAKASRRLAALRELLGQSELNQDELKALVAEVSELRTRSLEACVESILEVRRVLAPEQVQAMLSNCCRVESLER